jgi:hypothetical protein
MSLANRGKFVEEHIKARYQLKESELGFDGSFNNMEVEIKGCIPIHKNGVNRNGRDRITKGRFWIDNYAHKLLLNEKGLYVFVLYSTNGSYTEVLRTCKLFAFEVDYMINKGDNTKIRYDLIFPDYKVGAV